MSEPLARDRPIAIAPGFRLQWEEAQGAHVLLYPEGMVRLSGSAGAILGRCDGERTLDGVLASLKEAFPDADLEADVVEFLEIALGKGWIAQGQKGGKPRTRLAVDAEQRSDGCGVRSSST